MAITTKSALKEYILRQLGAPLVQVEVTEDQMDDIINQTVQQFSKFALEGELTKYTKMTISAPCELTVDASCTTILKVSKGGGLTFGGLGGSGFVLDYNSLVSGGIDLKDAIGSVMNLSATRSLLDKYFGDDIHFTWNPYKRKLQITEVFSGNIVIESAHEYIPDAVDYIFDNEWVQRMSVAKTKLLQSDTVGKHDATLVGGARINHEKMQSRAETEIEALKEELINRYAGPAPIMIG